MDRPEAVAGSRGEGAVGLFATLLTHVRVIPLAFRACQAYTAAQFCRFLNFLETEVCDV
jgi:hypothetical protein